MQEVMTIQPPPTPVKHGVPCLLSFVVPGLGQIVKGQFLKAIALWAWYVVAIVGAIAYVQVQDGQWLAGCLLISLFIAYLWNVIDAYNA